MLDRVAATARAVHNRDRQRRYRRRQANGYVVVTVTLSRAETDTLHRLRYLDLDKLEDRAAIAEAAP
jgi:hypothetical protein